MKYITLEEVCENRTSNISQKDLKKNEGIYPIYGASGLIKKVDFYTQDKEYIGIVKDGAGVGRIMLLPSKSSVICTMQYIIPNGILDTKYLYYALISKNLSKYSSGATIPHIYFKDYKKEKIALISESEQKKVINILDRIIDIINKRKNQINLLEELVKSRFIEMFGDPIKNEKGWDKIFIEEIASLVSRGKTPKYVEKSKIGVINQACIYWEKIKFENIKYHEDKKDILILQDQDILINSTGTGTLGRVNIFIKNKEKDIIYTIDTHITLLRLKQWKSNSIYLKNYFRIPIIQKYLINKCVNGSTNQIELSKEKFNNFRVLLPPLSLQNEFAEFVEKTNKLKFEAEKSLKEMENLYESLMQKFFKQN